MNKPIENPRLIICAGDYNEDPAQQVQTAMRVEAIIAGVDPLNELAQAHNVQCMVVDSGIRKRYATPPEAMWRLVAAPIPKGDLSSAFELGQRVAERCIHQAAIDCIVLGYIGATPTDQHTAINMMAGILCGAAEIGIPVMVSGRSGSLAFDIAVNHFPVVEDTVIMSESSDDENPLAGLARLLEQLP